MHVEVEHIVERIPPDPSLEEVMRYEHDLLRLIFEAGAPCLVARTYTSMPNEAHFLRAEDGNGQRPVTLEDLSSSLGREAIAHLRTLGREELAFLHPNNGYVELTT